jgi:hypothetical protein
MSTSKVLDDFLDLPEFAAEVKKHPRTVRRWMNEPNGLPYTWLGNQLFIHVPTAREWMLSRMHRPNPRAGSARRKPDRHPLAAAE